MGIISRALRPLTGPGIFWPQDYPKLEPGGRSLVGTRVDEESAFSLPVWFAAVRNMAEDIAKIPFIVYEQLERGKRRASEHALYRVLHDVANPEMTAFTWREVSMGHLLTWGNCYSEIVRDPQGQVRELWPLPPDRVQVKRDEDGNRYYVVRLARPNPDGSMEQVLDRKEVFHVPGLGYDGLVGYSPLQLLAKAIGVGLAAQEHAERFWANNGRPGGALTIPPEIDMSERAKEKLMRQWRANHEGLSNAQRIALLYDGITFEEIGIPPQDAQFVETRKFQVTEVARGLRMQPHKVGDLEHATFSNIEHQDLEYNRDSLGGWAGRIEAQTKKDLFRADEPYFGELLLDALLRADSITRARVWAIYTINGNVTPNYVNERENFPLREDPGGDGYMRPLNVAIESGGPSSSPGSLGSPEDVVKMTITAAPVEPAPNGKEPVAA